MKLEFILPTKTPIGTMKALNEMLSYIGRKDSLHEETWNYMIEINKNPHNTQLEYVHRHLKDGFEITFKYNKSGKISIISKRSKL